MVGHGRRILLSARHRHPGEVIPLTRPGAEPSVFAAPQRSTPTGPDVGAQTVPHPREPLRIWGGHRGGPCSGRTRRMIGAACVGVAAVLTACTTGDGQHSAAAGNAAGRAAAVITVGSFNFPESVLLAEIYGEALAAKKFPVQIRADLGPRELVDSALMDGLLQLVPEYAGSALEFVSLGKLLARPDVEGTGRALAAAAARRGLVAGHPAAAEDNNAIVVTAATAARYGLRSVGDLAAVAPRLAFGGPPECPERAYCLRGLNQTYGLHFKAFVPLDAGGPLTLQALDGGDIGAALLFTTDPHIAAHHLVVLADDRHLQPAENITPVLRRDVAVRYGPALLALLNAVSARLTTSAVRAMEARVELNGQKPRLVAGDWLRAQGLIPKERAVR
ncbi:MAG TPA: ABC transporter substrate-binding protein [Streptosporangiaceae bacterium]|nr:ABC transporter substrate-binding protein [Streptosporangiaceae bacterium]